MQVRLAMLFGGLAQRFSAKERAMTESHPLVKLARETIELYVREGKRPDPPKELPPRCAARLAHS